MRALIVDDEPLARRRIRELLASHEEIGEVDECADGRSAIDAIRTTRPDIVFLDVEMPDADGLRVAEATGAKHRPAIVFVTAHEQYAVDAFEIDAADYLVKPFTRRRFRESVERALRWSARGEQHAAPPPHLAVTTGDRTLLVPLASIDWIEAGGVYVCVHSGKATHVMRDALQRLEARLSPGFVRIHRSALVNVARVREIQRWFRGRYRVILADGTVLTSGSAFRANVRRLMSG